MSEETVEEEVEQKPLTPRQRRVTWLGAIAVAVIVAGAIGGAMGAFVPARHAAKAFTAALRAGRTEDARALAAKDLRPALDGAAPDSEDARTLELLRQSDDDSFSGYVGGYSDGCFPGDMSFASGGSRPLYVMLAVEDGAWRVKAVRSETMPDVCDISGD